MSLFNSQQSFFPTRKLNSGNNFACCGMINICFIFIVSAHSCNNSGSDINSSPDAVCVKIIDKCFAFTHFKRCRNNFSGIVFSQSHNAARINGRGTNLIYFRALNNQFLTDNIVFNRLLVFLPTTFFIGIFKYLGPSAARILIRLQKDFSVFFYKRGKITFGNFGNSNDFSSVKLFQASITKYF